MVVNMFGLFKGVASGRVSGWVLVAMRLGPHGTVNLRQLSPERTGWLATDR